MLDEDEDEQLTNPNKAQNDKLNSSLGLKFSGSSKNGKVTRLNSNYSIISIDWISFSSAKIKLRLFSSIGS